MERKNRHSDSAHQTVFEPDFGKDASGIRHRHFQRGAGTHTACPAEPQFHFHSGTGGPDWRMPH